MQETRPTIYDVAEHAGVGIATVSRVLNDSQRVRPQTRERVLAAIKELNYTPSKVARGLSRGQTHPSTLTIGVIVSFFTRPAFVERLRGIEMAVAEHKHQLTIFNVETADQRDARFREVIGRVDALLIVSLPPGEEDVARFLDSGTPTVLVDAPHPRLNSVVVRDVEGGRLATEHLIEKGHRKIAYIGDPFDNPFGFQTSRDRYTGYRQALETAGIPLREEYVLLGEHGQYRAKLMAKQLLNLDDPPTAIFAFSDTQAMGVLGAVRESGLTCPDDVSLVGFDDIEVAQYLGLTTVHQPLYESGLRAFELLMEVIEAPPASPVVIELPVTLIERQTTAPPKGAG